MFPLHPRVRERNFVLGVANGVFFNAGAAFTSGATVLPLFLSRLGASEALIGLLSCLDAFGWYLPQALVAGHLQGRPRTMPVYRFVALWRAGFIAAIPFLVLAYAERRPDLLLPLFTACFTLFALGSGLGGVSFMATVAKTVPAELTGVFFGARQFLGGLAGIGAGFAVRHLLAAGGWPAGFVWVFACAAALITLGLLSFSLVREPASPAAAAPAPFAARLAEGPRLFRADANFRRLFYAKGLATTYLLVSPFVILHLERLGAPPAWAGTYLACHYAGFLLSNLFWGPLSRRRGPRALLTASGAVFALAPLLVVFFARLGAPFLSFGLPFLLFGAGEAGSSIGYLAYTIERSTPENRPTYIGFLNTIVAPFHFFGALGGLLLSALPFEAVALLSSLLLLAGAAVSSRLSAGAP